MAAHLALAARLRRPAVVLGILTLLALTAAVLWPRPGPASANPLSGLSSVSAGGFHTCAVTTTGGIKCWGENVAGQLGAQATGSCVNIPCSRTPVDVSGLSTGVVGVAAGLWHTCAVTTSGGLRCWGSNDDGQLGDGTFTDRSTPVDVSGLTSGVAAVSAGGDHTCAVTTAGGVKCWGSNYHGQLGDGTTTDRTTPVSVSDLSSGVAAVAAGGDHTCAVTTAGGVKCWGDNGDGQLGDGTTTHRTTPVEVSGLSSGVAAVAAGYHHTCALTTAGGVKCWGGAYGSTPVAISGLASGVSAVAAGAGHTCALTTAGGVKCWGTAYTGTPPDVPGLSTGVAALAAGGSHTCAVATAGGLKCWGGNFFGQLGDGTTTDRATPVEVVTTGAKPTPTPTPCPPEGCPTPFPGLDFSLGVDTQGDGTDDCGTKAAGPTKCAVSLGSTFTLKVYLNTLPIDVDSYVSFDLYLTYAGVQSKDNITPAWPDCALPAPFYAAGEVAFGCVTGGAGSAYTGLMVTNDFNCTAGESAGNTITMVHGVADTILYARPGVWYVEGEGTTETLTINCVEPTPSPTPTPLSPQATPPPIGGMGVFPDPAGTGGPSGTGYGPVAGALAAVAASALGGLGCAAWYARRRRARVSRRA